MIRQNLTGRTFEQLVVKQFHGRTVQGNSLWVADCTCGKTVVVNGSQLLNGRTKSCGCKRRQHWKLMNKVRRLPYGMAAKNAYFIQYKNDCRLKDLEWAISRDTFFSLIVQPCFYCGDAPFRMYRGFVCNGVDRKNNQIGYVESNIVPCCHPCNFMKGRMSPEEFISQVKKVYQHQEV